jgi:hypothetical protein
MNCNLKINLICKHLMMKIKEFNNFNNNFKNKILKFLIFLPNANKNFLLKVILLFYLF